MSDAPHPDASEEFELDKTLLEKHLPVLVFSPDERFYPMDADIWRRSSELWQAVKLAPWLPWPFQRCLRGSAARPWDADPDGDWTGDPRAPFSRYLRYVRPHLIELRPAAWPLILVEYGLVLLVLGVVAGEVVGWLLTQSWFPLVLLLFAYWFFLFVNPFPSQPDPATQAGDPPPTRGWLRLLIAILVPVGALAVWYFLIFRPDSPVGAPVLIVASLVSMLAGSALALLLAGANRLLGRTESDFYRLVGSKPSLRRDARRASFETFTTFGLLACAAVGALGANPTRLAGGFSWPYGPLTLVVMLFAAMAISAISLQTRRLGPLRHSLINVTVLLFLSLFGLAAMLPGYSRVGLNATVLNLIGVLLSLVTVSIVWIEWLPPVARGLFLRTASDMTEASRASLLRIVVAIPAFASIFLQWSWLLGLLPLPALIDFSSSAVNFNLTLVNVWFALVAAMDLRHVGDAFRQWLAGDSATPPTADAALREAERKNAQRTGRLIATAITVFAALVLFRDLLPSLSQPPPESCLSRDLLCKIGLHESRLLGAAVAVLFGYHIVHAFRTRVLLLDGLFALVSGLHDGTGKAAAFKYRPELEAAWERGSFPVYGRVVHRTGAPFILLQYWFFYPFNDWRTNFNGMDDHEGDWEHVDVILDRDEQPVYLLYSQHILPGAFLRRAWNDPDVRKVHVDGLRTYPDGTEVWETTYHPVVYVAAGSHANYFRPGEHALEEMLRFSTLAQGAYRTVLSASGHFVDQFISHTILQPSGLSGALDELVDDFRDRFLIPRPIVYLIDGEGQVRFEHDGEKRLSEAYRGAGRTAVTIITDEAHEPDARVLVEGAVAAVLGEPKRAGYSLDPIDAAALKRTLQQRQRFNLQFGRRKSSETTIRFTIDYAGISFPLPRVEAEDTIDWELRLPRLRIGPGEGEGEGVDGPFNHESYQWHLVPIVEEGGEVVSPDWLRFNGHWGRQVAYDHESGPTGPGTKGEIWTTPVAYAGLLSHHPDFV